MDKSSNRKKDMKVSFLSPYAQPELNRAKSEEPARDRSNSVISEAPGYCGDIKIYGVGIMEDKVPGTKRGKGV